MNNFATSYPLLRPAALLLPLLVPLLARAVVFTSDTVIPPTSATDEGQKIVVSNAVLTVDGPHAFASLRGAAGATLATSGSE